VAVNRLWLHLFGRGLVETPDNFGRLSEPPTHPELLDFLARRFVEQGWSIKASLRSIMLSSTYQMSCEFDSSAYAKDPDNRSFWRMNRRRLEAEALRDAILAVSNELDRTLGGTVAPTNMAAMPDLSQTPPAIESKRRSIYLPVIRNNIGDLFQAFDFPDPHVVSGKRHATTAPTQALFMLNSPFISQQAGHCADVLLASPGQTEAQRITAAYERALGRQPSKKEADRSLQFIAATSGGGDSGKDIPAERREAWEHFCQALLVSTEFRFLE
jgi:hypothetical protein